MHQAFCNVRFWDKEMGAAGLCCRTTVLPGEQTRQQENNGTLINFQQNKCDLWPLRNSASGSRFFLPMKFDSQL